MAEQECTNEVRLLRQGTLRRGWEDTEKCLAHSLFWVAEVFVGGTVGVIYGGMAALLFVLALFVAVFIVATVTAPARQRDELRRAFNVAVPTYDAAAWLTIEKEFRDIANTSVAVAWVSRAGGPKEWNVWGDGQRRFAPLAERAGNMLLRTPLKSDFVAADLLAETNPLWRWLCLLATDGTTLEITGNGFERDNQGNKIFHESGGLKSPQERSANMCAAIAAKIA